MNHALETRLARAANADLPALLAELEGADWALTFEGEAKLFAALAKLGGATLRADPRLPLTNIAGFEVGAFDADWRASTVLLLEPDDRLLRRARKAEATVVADGTFCPGGGMLARGAALVIYRDAGALSGFADVPFAALLGKGEAPEIEVRGTGPLASALVLRGLPTLGARLARQTRAAGTLAERLGERAETVSGAVLLLRGDVPATALFDENAPLGGVSSARRTVSGGTLLSAGLESVEDLWRDLTGDAGISAAKIADETTPEALLPEVLLPEVLPEPEPQPESRPETEQVAEPEVSPEPEPERPIAPDLPTAPQGEVADPAADLTDEQRAAYERLREWRNAEARRAEVSRFIIASNATLAEIARRAPQSEEELRAVKGMGPERVRKYAAPILNMLRGMRA